MKKAAGLQDPSVQGGSFPLCVCELCWQEVMTPTILCKGPKWPDIEYIILSYLSIDSLFLHSIFLSQ